MEYKMIALEDWLWEREPDNDAVKDGLYEKYLNRGYAPKVAERLALEEFDKVG